LAKGRWLGELSSRLNDAGVQQTTVEGEDLVRSWTAGVVTFAEEHQPLARQGRIRQGKARGFQDHHAEVMDVVPFSAEPKLRRYASLEYQAGS